MTDDTDQTRIAIRTCPLCEAGCGLEITLEPDGAGGERVKRIRGDRDDVFSKGYICPKGSTLGHLHDDPDRLRRPVVKRDGEFVEVDWDEAFATIEAGLLPILERHGRDAAAIYLGNPGAHSMGPMLYSGVLIRALGTRNRFSASTVDQRPKEITTALMFGSVTAPVPDLDRTDHLIILGANPLASNGSLCTAPDFPGRLQRIQERGGTVVVVDPRRSETAAMADRHVAVRPGTDAHLLAAMAHTIITEGLADPGPVAQHCADVDRLPDLLAPFAPEAVATVCGIAADNIRSLARDLCAAPTGAVYGRIGTTTQEFGTLASWLVDVVNLLSGNLDRVGGAMFAKGAVRNVANYSPPVLPLDDGQPDEWEILLRLAAICSGDGVDADIDALDDGIVRSRLASAVKDPWSKVHGRDADELYDELGDRRGPERMLDLMLRIGPYGDGFGSDPDGVSLDVLMEHPHGVDLGALEAGRIPDLLRTPSGKVEVVPEPIEGDLPRLVASLDRAWDDALVLIGRRHVRSNNSWMHNVRVLTKGRNRCTLQIHPDDADRLGLSDGGPTKVTSRVGEVIVDAEVTDGIRPGVVSIPHGFGQNQPGVRLRVASEYRGVNTNELTDEQFFDEVSGNIALNGVPVTVAPA